MSVCADYRVGQAAGRGSELVSYRPVTSAMSPPGTNRPNQDVRIHGSFRKDNGHATDIAGRPNLTQTGPYQSILAAVRSAFHFTSVVTYGPKEL